MSKYLPGIFGDKSDIGKRLTETYGLRKKSFKEHKPQGAALALSKKLTEKKHKGPYLSGLTPN